MTNKYKKTLITTPLETIKNKKHKNVFFAGDWCFKNSNSTEINFNQVFSNIWDNSSVLQKDINFLVRIHKKINTILTEFLFLHHKGNIRKEVIYQFVFIWLVYYVSFYFFKWKTIDKIFHEIENLIFKL